MAPRVASRAGRWAWLFPVAVVLVALVAAWPAMAEPGLLNTRGGGDSPFLLQRLHQLTAALADGHFPARWMPDAAYGYGYPFYNFYAPLSLYIAAAFRFLGFSFVRAIQLAQLAGFVVAGLGTFHLARRWLGSPWAGLLAAVAYTVAPFHMVNVFVRGDSLAEFWAMAWYPWVLLAADGLVAGGGWRVASGGSLRADDRPQTTDDANSPPATHHPPLATRIALFALAYAALILSHNISALIFSPFLLLYMLFGFLRRSRGAGEQGRHASPLLPRFPAPPLLIAAALLLAFALAAWFFVPALAEQDLAQLGPVTEGYFHYSNHFRGLDLVQRGLLFDYNPDGGVAFRMGLAQAVLALAGAAVWLWRLNDRRLPTTDRRRQMTDDRRQTTADDDSPPATRHSPPWPLAPGPWPLIFAFTLATFMITPLARPLWDHLPLLSFTQFPWRFLSVQALFAALLTAGLALDPRSPAPLLPRSPAPLLAIGASLVLSAAALLSLTTDHLILSDADVTAERLAQYEWFTGNIGTTISAEYLPPAAVPRPWTSAWLNLGQRDQAVAVAGELTAATLASRTTTRQVWQLDAGPDGATVVLPTFYWPGWRATLDGQPAELAAQPGSGLMTLTIPAGRHTVSLELHRTPVRAAAEWLSLGALIVTIGLLVAGWRRTADPYPPPATRRSPSATRYLPLILVALLPLLLAFLWRNDPQELPDGDLNWDFAQMAYLHHAPDGVGFGHGQSPGRTWLYEYGYSGESVTAGEMLTVTLSVAPGDGRAATLALVTPASARPAPDGAPPPPVLAAATQPATATTVVFTLPIPPDAPPGLYLPRLTLDGAPAMLPSGGTRGELFLRPIRVTAGSLPPWGRVREGDLNAQGAAQPSPQPSPIGRGGSVLDVRATQLALRDATTLDGRFAWYTDRPLGARYQFSWRLQDAAGAVLAQLDAQPGYGFLPSTVWPAGEWTADWLALRLPDVAPAAGDYPLVMRLYDVGSGATVLTRRVGVAAWRGGAWSARLHEPSFGLPNDLSPLSVTFSQDDQPLIELPGYHLARDGDALRITFYWRAVGAPGDFSRFIHLLDAAGAIAAQVDGAPAGDSYPTGQWVAGEVVADAVTFDLSALPPGDYRLAAGFYAPTAGLPRLDAADAASPLPDGRVLLHDEIVVE